MLASVMFAWLRAGSCFNQENGKMIVFAPEQLVQTELTLIARYTKSGAISKSGVDSQKSGVTHRIMYRCYKAIQKVLWYMFIIQLSDFYTSLLEI